MKKLLIISLFIGASMQASEWDKATDAVIKKDLQALQAAYCNDPTILTRRTTRRGWTLLHIAELESSEFLIMQGIDVNAQGNQGETALMIAVTFGSDDVVELLLRHGARTDIRNRSGKSVLDMVARDISDPRVVRIYQLLHEAQAKEAQEKIQQAASACPQ